MKKTSKKIIFILAILIAILAVPTIIKAADDTIYTATSTVNGVTVNWSYKLDDSNQIIDLECNNPTELTGNITIPSTLDGKAVISLKSKAFKGSPLTAVTIPSGIKKIGNGAFANCSNLATIDLGKVEQIEFDAFKDCTALKEITIPKTLDSDFGATSAVFSGCTNLKKITLEDGLKIVPSYLCASTPIEEIAIPDSVTKISFDAFANCTNLTTVDLGSVEQISFDAFKDCTALKEITIPKTLDVDFNTTSAVFKGCTNLKKITLEDGLKIVPSYLCAGTPIEEITVPDSVTKISYKAFTDCTNLKKITILDNVEAMGFYTSYSTDSIFQNHNEDLTIYCYQDSLAAKYAIKYDIKYTYLTKKADDVANNDKETNNNTEDTNKEKEKSNNTDSSNKVKETNNDKDKETSTKTTKIDETKNVTSDSSKMPKTLPKTGIEVTLIGVVIVIAVFGLFAYKKYNIYKDIK